ALALSSLSSLFLFLLTPPPPISTLFPYTTLFRSYFYKIATDSPFYLFAVLRQAERSGDVEVLRDAIAENPLFVPAINKLIAYNVQNGKRRAALRVVNMALDDENLRSEEHTSELQSRFDLVCRLLLEKKKMTTAILYQVNLYL